MIDIQRLENISKSMRYWVLKMTHAAGSGHPTYTFPYAEAATGSLGQGLSIGEGMALNAKYIDRLPYHTYVLLGDSEMSEGSQWEAIELARHYRLNNLTGIVDVNRLGQRGETLWGHDLQAYQRRLAAFGWQTVLIDGHDMRQIVEAFHQERPEDDRPRMVIARTVKGKGVSFLEDQEGWHGKALDDGELERALGELGEVDPKLRGAMVLPENLLHEPTQPRQVPSPAYAQGEEVATRKAYGRALTRLYPAFPDLVVLDGEVSNSTYSELFKARYPQRFFEMFVAEQNMVGAACGLAARGRIPFVSTFAAFQTRAFDQLRMDIYGAANIKLCGSHAGVAIGPDGPSQMGLEDIAMFRSLAGSVVFYPADAVATEKLVEAALRLPGLVYLRTTRNPTPVIYPAAETFSAGGSKVLRQSAEDRATLAAAGITLHEALAAHDMLKPEGIAVRVIDLYSLKPLDLETLRRAADETGCIITVEDHYPAGGIGEAVAAALGDHPAPVHNLAVTKMPKSGTPRELLRFEEISRDAIVRKLRAILGVAEQPPKSGEETRRASPAEARGEVETEVCTKAPEWAEHQRLDDPDQPCDDGRAGKGVV
jgi:transketolase